MEFIRWIGAIIPNGLEADWSLGGMMYSTYVCFVWSMYSSVDPQCSVQSGGAVATTSATVHLWNSISLCVFLLQIRILFVFNTCFVFACFYPPQLYSGLGQEGILTKLFYVIVKVNDHVGNNTLKISTVQTMSFNKDRRPFFKYFILIDIHPLGFELLLWHRRLS